MFTNIEATFADLLFLFRIKFSSVEFSDQIIHYKFGLTCRCTKISPNGFRKTICMSTMMILLAWKRVISFWGIFTLKRERNKNLKNNLYFNLRQKFPHPITSHLTACVCVFVSVCVCAYVFTYLFVCAEIWVRGYEKKSQGRILMFIKINPSLSLILPE